MRSDWRVDRIAGFSGYSVFQISGSRQTMRWPERLVVTIGINAKNDGAAKCVRIGVDQIAVLVLEVSLVIQTGSPPCAFAGRKPLRPEK